MHTIVLLGLVLLSPGSRYDDTYPVLSPDGRRIAFESDRSGHIQAMVMNADGSEPRPLADPELTSGFPRWLPDGKRFAYHARRPGEDWQVFLANVDGGTVERLTEGFRYGFEPVPAPDGSTLIVIGRKDGDPEGPTHLYLISLADRSAVRITGDHYRKYQPSWSPDGKRIVYGAQSPEGVWEIFIVSAEGSATSRLTRNMEVDSSQPAWSHDGRTVACVCADAAGQALCLVDVATGTVREIEETRPLHPKRPSWSPDDRRILFDGDGAGSYDIYSVELDSARVRQLTSKPESPFIAMARQSGVAAAIAAYDATRRENRDAVLVRAREIQRLSDAFHSTGRTQDALELLRFAVREFPGAATYSALSAQLRREGRWAPPNFHEFFTAMRRDGSDRAQQLYRRTRSLYPGWLLFDPVAMRRLGFHYLDQGDPTRAVSAFEMLADSYPNEAWAFEGLGRAFVRLGRLDEAQRAYERLLEISPQDTDAADKLKAIRERATGNGQRATGRP